MTVPGRISDPRITANLNEILRALRETETKDLHVDTPIWGSDSRQVTLTATSSNPRVNLQLVLTETTGSIESADAMQCITYSISLNKGRGFWYLSTASMHTDNSGAEADYVPMIGAKALEIIEMAWALAIPNFAITDPKAIEVVAAITRLAYINRKPFLYDSAGDILPYTKELTRLRRTGQAPNLDSELLRHRFTVEATGTEGNLTIALRQDYGDNYLRLYQFQMIGIQGQFQIGSAIYSDVKTKDIPLSTYVISALLTDLHEIFCANNPQ